MNQAATIDRLSPTRRPEGRPAGHQRWRSVSLLHWPVPAAVIRPLVPPQLELDTFDGTCFVGLVPFTMSGVRPWWAPPVPGLSAFHETNVRTYVHLGGRDPGVWFFSLEAANRMAVWIARTFWGLPYHHARMSLAAGKHLVYTSTRRSDGARCRVAVKPTGTPAPAAPDSLEHFLAERYILYATMADRLYAGRVNHRPYPLQPAEILACDETLLAAAGVPRAGAPLGHYASGVDVEVFPLRAAG